MSSVAGTGHRPTTRKDPDGIRPQDMEWVREKARAGLTYLAERGTTEVWTGMALGFDLTLARAALSLGLPVVAHIPYPNQADRWSDEQRAEWEYVRARVADEVIYGREVFDHESATALLKERNRGLIQADAVFACWTGQLVGERWAGRRRGGTWSAVAMAQRAGRSGVHICPATRRVRIVEPGGWF